LSSLYSLDDEGDESLKPYNNSELASSLANSTTRHERNPSAGTEDISGVFLGESEIRKDPTMSLNIGHQGSESHHDWDEILDGETFEIEGGCIDLPESLKSSRSVSVRPRDPRAKVQDLVDDQILNEDDFQRLYQMEIHQIQKHPGNPGSTVTKMRPLNFKESSQTERAQTSRRDYEEEGPNGIAPLTDRGQGAKSPSRNALTDTTPLKQSKNDNFRGAVVTKQQVIANTKALGNHRKTQSSTPAIVGNGNSLHRKSGSDLSENDKRTVLKMSGHHNVLKRPSRHQKSSGSSSGHRGAKQTDIVNGSESLGYGKGVPKSSSAKNLRIHSLKSPNHSQRVSAGSLSAMVNKHLGGQGSINANGSISATNTWTSPTNNSTTNNSGSTNIPTTSNSGVGTGPGQPVFNLKLDNLKLQHQRKSGKGHRSTKTSTKTTPRGTVGEPILKNSLAQNHAAVGGGTNISNPGTITTSHQKAMTGGKVKKKVIKRSSQSSAQTERASKKWYSKSLKPTPTDLLVDNWSAGDPRYTSRTQNPTEGSMTIRNASAGGSTTTRSFHEKKKLKGSTTAVRGGVNPYPTQLNGYIKGDVTDRTSYQQSGYNTAGGAHELMYSPSGGLLSNASTDSLRGKPNYRSLSTGKMTSPTNSFGNAGGSSNAKLLTHSGSTTNIFFNNHFINTNFQPDSAISTTSNHGGAGAGGHLHPDAVHFGHHQSPHNFQSSGGGLNKFHTLHSPTGSINMTPSHHHHHQHGLMSGGSTPSTKKDMMGVHALTARGGSESHRDGRGYEMAVPSLKSFRVGTTSGRSSFVSKAASPKKVSNHKTAVVATAGGKAASPSAIRSLMNGTPRGGYSSNLAEYIKKLQYQPLKKVHKK